MIGEARALNTTLTDPLRNPHPSTSPLSLSPTLLPALILISTTCMSAAVLTCVPLARGNSPACGKCRNTRNRCNKMIPPRISAELALDTDGVNHCRASTRIIVRPTHDAVLHSALWCCAPGLECIQHSVHSKSLALKCTRHSVHSTQWALSTQCHSPYRHSVLSVCIVCGPMCPCSGLP